MSRRKRYGVSKYRYVGNRVYRPIPIDFGINRNSWDPRGEPEQRITFANGTPVRVNTLHKDCCASACLLNLQVQIMDFGHRFVIDCDNIKFNCMSPNAKKPTENKIQECLRRMQNGKCPYKFARRIFTNIPTK